MPGLLTPLAPLRGQQAPGRSAVNRPIRRMGLSPMSATTFAGCCGVIKTVGRGRRSRQKRQKDKKDSRSPNLSEWMWHPVARSDLDCGREP